MAGRSGRASLWLGVSRGCLRDRVGLLGTYVSRIPSLMMVGSGKSGDRCVVLLFTMVSQRMAYSQTVQRREHT